MTAVATGLSPPSLDDPRMLPVPSCAICGADSTGIHFGVEACAACSAFFRRTVVLKKEYLCSKDGKCAVSKGLPGSQKCRSCRFKKCLNVGMDKSAVQLRRDAIGRYSTIKRECPSPDYNMTTGAHTDGHTSCPTSPKSPKRSGSPMLQEIIDKYHLLGERRRMFYIGGNVTNLFDTEVKLKPAELEDFGDCMYQLWRIEPRLCAEFVGSLSFLSCLTPQEKTKMFKNFLLQFQAVEEPYLTMIHGGLEKKWWIMPNNTYVDFQRADYYFEQLIMRALKLDKVTAVKLFVPSFQHAMDLVGEQMQEMHLTEPEMIALFALLLLDPTAKDLLPASRVAVQKLRDELFRDIFNFYLANDEYECPEERFGSLLMLITPVKIHAQKSLENMHLLRFFDVIPRDKMFDAMWG